jgi:hypothetical protein
MSIVTFDDNGEIVRAGGVANAADHDSAEDSAETIRKLRSKMEDYHRRRARQAGWVRRFIPTTLAALDAALPYGGLPCGAITEILCEDKGLGTMSLALRIAGRCVGSRSIKVGGTQPTEEQPNDQQDVGRALPAVTHLVGNTHPTEEQPNDRRNVGRALPAVTRLVGDAHSTKRLSTDQSRGHQIAVIVDALGDFYPPAACQHGLATDRLVVIRTRRDKDAFWAVDQSLRCPGVAVVIAPLPGLDERLSRRLQLAAESSGCIGLILKPARRRVRSFAAVQMLVEGVPRRESAHPVLHDHYGSSARDAHFCRITLLTVREGTPAGPLLVDLRHETGALPVHPLPVDRAVAKTG